MADKDNISEYSETPIDNDNIGGITLQENVMLPSQVNNAFREQMAQLKAWFRTSLFRIWDGTDITKALAFDLSALPTATTVTVTAPPASGVMATTGLLANRPTLANDSTDPTNDTLISTGVAFDANTAATGLTAVKCASLIKRLDANWAVGTNQGMRYSGAAIANATYHIWACWTDAGVQDYYADPSAVQATVLGHLQAEAGGSAYTHLGYVGAIVRVSGAIKAFTQVGDTVVYAASNLDFSVVNPGGGTAFTATLLVPTGIPVLANITGISTDSAAGTSILFSPLDANDETPDQFNNCSAAVNTVGGSAVFTGSIKTNTSAQIRGRLSGGSASVTVNVRTRGFTYIR